MQNLISEIEKKNPDLKTAEIIGLLYILKTTPNLSNNDLIRLCGLPKPVIREFKSSIGHLLADQQGDDITVSVLGMMALNELDLVPYKWSLISSENLEVEKELNLIRKKYNLEPKREFDQFFATVQSSVAKAQLLIDKGLADNQQIALMGDDDLVSIALCLLTKRYLKIVVYDIDDRLLKVIDQIVKDYNLVNIETKLHDIRKPFTPDVLNRFDVVLIDPPYTKTGIELFLARSVELLKRDNTFKGKYILMNFGAGFRNPEKEIKIQEVITHYNILIEDKLNKYTRYFGAETVGSASSIYVLKTTAFTVVSPTIHNKDIYTYENEAEEKFPFTDHYVFKIFKVARNLVESKKALLKASGEFCRIHNLKVVDTIITKFKGKGLSITLILSTSNLVMHTWPEYNAIHIDLITCSPILNKQNMATTWSKLLLTKFIETIRIE